MKRSSVMAVLAVAAFAVPIRLFRLDTLPGELYGDIAIVYEYVSGIRAGNWPIDFVLSSGPLYHYLITPFTMVVGLNFYTLKLAAVIVSLSALVAIYFMTHSLSASRSLALLTVAVAAISSWLLVFSRLGNNQIILPLLTAVQVRLIWIASQKLRVRDAVLAGFVSSLGLYSCAPGFVLPLAGLMMFASLWRRGPRHNRQLLVFAFSALITALPFAVPVRHDPANFTTGYIGEKLLTDWNVFASNIVSAALSYHFRGDSVFRSNPAHAAHLDPVSGLLFLIGIIYWFLPERRSAGAALFVFLVFLHIPSILVKYRGEVPSASRTVAAIPIVYLYVASGAQWLAEGVKKRRWVKITVLQLLLIAILSLNVHRYFNLYARGLPNHNVAFGRMIADYIEALPQSTSPYVIGCCWGEAGQPEPTGIKYILPKQKNVQFIDPAALDCDAQAKLARPAILILAPTLQLRHCITSQNSTIHYSKDGQAVFRTIDLPQTRHDVSDHPSAR